MNSGFNLKISIAIICLFSFLNVTAQTTFNYTGASQNFAVPANVTCVQIEVWGAGGGGGAGTANNDSGGSGGGGCYTTQTVTVVPSSNLTIVIGAGGTAGTAGAAGGNGGTSTVTGNINGVPATVISAGGGNGGANGNNTGNTGAGCYVGGNGAAAGGNSSGDGGAGQNGGAGGAGVNGNPGNPGTVPGGGGSGGGDLNNGAAGAHGRVRITPIARQCPSSTSISPVGPLVLCQGVAGTVLTATVPVTGTCGTPTIQYQWYSNTSGGNTIATSTLIGGATSSTFTTPTGSTGTTYYFCVAYASDNSCGQTAATQSQASNAVQVQVVFPCPVDYTHPTTGIAGERVGACLVSTCSGSYFDDGGASGNYSSIGPAGIYRVFCPATAGNCTRVTFNSFSTEAALDYLTIGNGATQNSTVFTTAPASGLGRISGTPAVPFSYTSTDASGCLSFRFFTDGSVVSSGWSATLSCVPCAGGPDGTSNTDCINATPLCSSAAVGANASGPGIVAEGCTGTVCPAGGENHTNWYEIQAFTSGTLDITITPSTGTDDYDFAIYGPNATCGALGSPLRCSDSGDVGATGTAGAAVEFSEDVTGDKFVATMNVTAGQSFYIMVDEWTANTGTGYTLSFGGTASLDCVILPVALSEFYVNYIPEEKGADIYWKTDSERNNDYFTVEKSKDGIVFETIGNVKGAGTTSLPTEYYAYDPNVDYGVTYYRLKQTDFDGEFDYSDVFSINALPEENDVLTMFPNPTTDVTELIFNCNQKGESVVNVTDSKGFVLYSQAFECISGGNRIEVDLSNSLSGIYFVTVTTNSKVYTGKLLKN